jgi:sensor histidine kinase YesM
MPKIRSLSRLAGIIFGLLAVWQLYAAFIISEFLHFDAMSHGISEPAEVIAYNIVVGLLWALFTPLVVFIAERLPVQKPYSLTNILILVALVPVLALLRAGGGGAIMKWGEDQPITLDFVSLSINLRFYRNVFLIAAIIVIANIFEAQRRAAVRERDELALQKKLADAELERLRASTQPRFLFAMLDSIASAIRTRPAAADRLIVGLGDLLRRSLHQEPKGIASFGRELELIDEYVELENVRSGGAFHMRMSVAEELLEATVPSLLLHPLIEARIVEGRASSIEIHARIKGNRLCIELHDFNTTALPDAVAIAETNARLEGQYAGRASMRCRQEPAAVVTELCMPFAVAEEEGATWSFAQSS